MSLFLLPGSEHGVGREFFICEDAAFVTAVCPRIVFLYSVTLFLPTSSNTAYSLSGIRRFDTILPCPHEDEQDQCLSSAGALGKYQISDEKYIWNNSYLNCWWRWKWTMIIAINFQFKQSFLSNFCGLDKSTIPPVYLQLSTTLYRPSWAAVHNTLFLSAFSLLLCIFIRWSRSVTTTVNKWQWRQAFACRRF